MATVRRRSRGGARALASFLKENQISYRVAAEALGVTATAVWEWAHASKMPTTKHREYIAIWTAGRVPESVWGDEPRRDVKPFVAEDASVPFVAPAGPTADLPRPPAETECATAEGR